MNLLVLIPLAVLGVGLVAVLLLAGRIGEQAAGLVAALRGFRDLEPALVELRDEAAEARALVERLRRGAH